MAISKVVYGNTTLIDITDTTATASDVVTGKYFYLPNGEKIQGTSVGGGMTVVETIDEYGGTIVDISGDPVVLQTKTATPSTSSQILIPDSGFKGLSEVTVEAIPSKFIIPTGTISISSNGIVDVASYASASINVQPVLNLQSKTVTPDETGMIVAADTGYTALSSVTVVAVNSNYVGSNITRQTGSTISPTESIQTAVASGKYTTGDVKIGAISSNYVGSNITTRTSLDLGASGSVVTAPAGYYQSAATKNISAGTAATPATTISITPSISVNTSTGVITATASGSQFVTPTISAGYVSAGTSGKITVSGSNTSNLTTQAAATITPTKSSQTAVAANRYTTGAVTVAAIPAAYQDVTSVTATASDVLSGKTIVNSSGTTVNGSLVIQHYYTGSSTPTAATGSNGDIYLKTS